MTVRPTKRIPHVDVKAIIEAFEAPGSSVSEVVRLCKALGYAIEVDALRKALQRNRITMDTWLLLSSAYRDAFGKELDLKTFTRWNK